MPGRVRLALTGLAVLALAGCGNSRTPVAQVTAPARPAGGRTLSYPAAGVRFIAPANWAAVPQRSPLVAVVTSGNAVVSVWRYTDAGAAPSTPAALTSARARLIAAARSRDPHLDVLRATTTRLDGVPAVELDALEHIGSQLRRVQSTHLFAYGAEIVLDEYAPPSLFGTVDREVFVPLQKSLVLSPAAA
jgi:hypothetical protein